jgi:hypothetical protein
MWPLPVWARKLMPDGPFQLTFTSMFCSAVLCS